VKRFSKIVGYVIGAAVATVALAGLVVPGCTGQNQNVSPITVNNSQGRLMLSVTCSTDGSVAYVTDGRNVYRYDHNASGTAESWECILSQGQRLEMAGKYDPRELPPSEGGSEKTGSKSGKPT
jgi:phage protein U